MRAVMKRCKKMKKFDLLYWSVKLQIGEADASCVVHLRWNKKGIEKKMREQGTKL